jgi:hypothetical protein
MDHPLRDFNKTTVDLNKAFADNWDKKNPSIFKQACNFSRQLREDYENDKKSKERFMNTFMESLKQPK